MDDTDDIQALSILLDPSTPEGFDLCNTESVPGVNNIVTNLQVMCVCVCVCVLMLVFVYMCICEKVLFKLANQISIL